MGCRFIGLAGVAGNAANPVVLNVLERILQREGYAVETAVNGVGQARCRCTGAVEKTSGNAKMRGFLPT